MKLTNSYYQLGPEFFQEIMPVPVACPKLLLLNSELAEHLHLSDDIKHNAANYFSGNQLLAGSKPIAAAYAGHQFAFFNHQLGDGRAHLLGELCYSEGSITKQVDIQLKGSGQNRFSRRGDGRCALKPAVREFIMSAAMQALGVPTTQTLSVVCTGEDVLRQSIEPGAVVCRVASSHIRVGTFQYFAAKGDLKSLKTLLDFAIERHFPEIDIQQHKADKAIQFLQKVINRQINTVVHWMRVGFIHGVMNTDNVAISGETLDYGPCAMMGTYHPETVFSSIDDNSRYCYINQPAITQWNMARLAETLLPFVDDDVDQAIRIIEPYINQFTTQYQDAYHQMMAKKLGIFSSGKVSLSDRKLTDQLLDIMQQNKLDYTQTFIYLMAKLEQALVTPLLTENYDLSLSQWVSTWRNKVDRETALPQMRASNPLLIPRNHHLEAVLTDCRDSGSTNQVDKLLTVLRSPYKMQADTANYQTLDELYDKRYQTFCGT